MDSTGKLGKYEIQGVLGEGGMGIVYKALDPSLDRTVAIKTIRINLLGGKSGEELRQRFRREAQAEGRLLHPNIVAIYEYQEDEAGMPFFVMEFVEGKSLKEYIARGLHFNLEKSVIIVEQMLSALAYSHSKGIIHRDIKPANIILLEDDTIKIADFGISKIEGSDFTQTGQIMGTPQYISPEQRMGKRTDGRSDLYSTGAVLFELLTGVKALPGASFVGATSTRQEHQQPSTLDTGDPATMRVYKQVVLKALAKDPEDRFQDAAEFSETIKRALIKQKARSHERNKWLMLGGILGGAVLAGAYYLSEPLATGPTPGPSGKVRAPRTTPVSPVEQEKIDRYLKVGKTHAMIGRLILPQGSNAYNAFDMVLDIDPGNSNALAGIEDLRERVIAGIRMLVGNGEYERAKNQVAVALARFPGNKQLQELHDELAKN